MEEPITELSVTEVRWLMWILLVSSVLLLLLSNQGQGGLLNWAGGWASLALFLLSILCKGILLQRKRDQNK